MRYTAAWSINFTPLTLNVVPKYWGRSTALIVASVNGHTEIVTSLLAAGANVNAKTNGGPTALDVARKQGHGDVVKILEAAGAK
jgi:ankyrin repeat protein